MIILRIVFIDFFFFLELKVSVGGWGFFAKIKNQNTVRFSLVGKKKREKKRTNFMISSTLKSFLHFSALANISFVFERSNLRVRRNLKRSKKKKDARHSKIAMKNSKIVGKEASP